INPHIEIKSIEEIKNPYLEEIYEGLKKVIRTQCSGFNPNERELFHGTSGDGIKGITEYGFDDRFYNPDGAWGKFHYLVVSFYKMLTYSFIIVDV
ncbi:unnamed protein product, partial [Rotaria sp. Silwood2]